MLTNANNQELGSLLGAQHSIMKLLRPWSKWITKISVLRGEPNLIILFHFLFHFIPAVTFEGFFQSLRLRSLQLNEVHSRGLRSRATFKKAQKDTKGWMWAMCSSHSSTFFNLSKSPDSILRPVSGAFKVARPVSGPSTSIRVRWQPGASVPYRPIPCAWQSGIPGPYFQTK